MRFIKPIIILIILGLIAAFAWQNLPTFNAEQPFQLSLYFGQPIKWTHSVLSLVGIAAILGFVVGVLVMLKPFLNLRKKVAQERQDKPEQEVKAPQE
jgi:hypothetical protein